MKIECEFCGAIMDDYEYCVHSNTCGETCDWCYEAIEGEGIAIPGEMYCSKEHHDQQHPEHPYEE